MEKALQKALNIIMAYGYGYGIGRRQYVAHPNGDLFSQAKIIMQLPPQYYLWYNDDGLVGARALMPSFFLRRRAKATSER
jgi:hypothetical protein